MPLVNILTSEVYKARTHADESTEPVYQ